jgi:hypothetical protein
MLSIFVLKLVMLTVNLLNVDSKGQNKTSAIKDKPAAAFSRINIFPPAKVSFQTLNDSCLSCHN